MGFQLLLLQVNNENFWIAALAVVAYVLFAGNVCCYNGSHNQSRPESFKRTPWEWNDFKKPFGCLGYLGGWYYLHVYYMHMYLYGDTCELLKGSQLMNQDLMECKIGFCCFNCSTDVSKNQKVGISRKKAGRFNFLGWKRTTDILRAEKIHQAWWNSWTFQ